MTDYLRASDNERREVSDLLFRHFVDGRLEREELNERIDEAMQARTRGELDRLVSDLPPLAMSSEISSRAAPGESPVGPHGRDGTPSRRRRRIIVAGATVIVAVVAALGTTVASTERQIPPAVVAVRTHSVTLPDVLGELGPQAASRLQMLGLRFESLLRYDSNAPAGVVFAESPNAGSRVRRGSVVSIMIATPRRA